jgi:hypothetical protein
VHDDVGRQRGREEAFMPVDVWQYRESTKFSAQSVDLSGFEVVGRDGSIGTVDKASNDVRVNYIIIDTGDWLPGRQVMLPAYAVERIDAGARKVYIDRTREEIRNSPELDPKELRSARFEDALTGYYHGMYDTGL